MPGLQSSLPCLTNLSARSIAVSTPCQAYSPTAARNSGALALSPTNPPLDSVQRGITGRCFAVDSANEFNFSIQLFYANEPYPPVMVVIGNYFRAGQLPALTDDAKAEIAKHAEQQLEGVYAVRVVDAKMGNVQGIELILTKR